MKYLVEACLCLALVSPLMAMRTHNSNSITLDSNACNENTCMTFKPEDKCSCKPFLQDHREKLRARVGDSMFEVLRKLRHMTDKLSKDSWTVTKLYYGTKLGALQKKLLFLEEGVKEMPELEAAFAKTPIKAFKAKYGTALPAGTLPIMVEIWDHHRLGADVQLGEVGVPLDLGDHLYRNQLLAQNDIHTVSSSPHSTKVTFSTSVSMVPSECQLTYEQGTTCVDISLTVKCIDAKDLPEDRTPNAFCKVRVKTDPLASSEKRRTPQVQDRNPVFTENEWSFSWQEPLVLPIPQNAEAVATPPSPDTFVPLTIDEFSMFELAESEVLYLASSVFIQQGVCDGSKVKPVCKLLDKLSRMTIDEEALKSVQDIAHESKGTDAGTVAADVVAVAPEVVGSSMLESEAISSDKATSFEAASIFQRIKSLSEGKASSPIFAAAIAGGRRGGGGGGLGGGSNGKGLAAFLFIFFILILIIGLAA